ncbi:hypothetical protein, partial [Fulvivirga lutimaris]|uniref:hypothetical protein n=1 Tax=Fulvivirga lutimaris TaxID=1819566 RepID=UPI0012BD0931
MKLSNKILIGFFGFAFIYMTAAFTEIRLKGDPNRIDEFNGVMETVGINNVNYLVLPDLDHRITIMGSDNPRIEVKSLKGDLLKYLKYNIKGDTLTLESLELEERQNLVIYIHVPKNNFVGLTSNNAGISIGELELANLTIVQTDGWIRIGENNKLGTINLTANQGAYFNASDAEIDTLSATIEDSQISISSSLKLAKG